MDCRDKLPGEVLPTPLFPDGRGEIINIFLPDLECEIKSYFLPSDLDLRNIRLNKNPVECIKPQKSKIVGEGGTPAEPYSPGIKPGTEIKDTWIDLTPAQFLNVKVDFGIFNEFYALSVPQPISPTGNDLILDIRTSPGYTQFGGLISATRNFDQAVALWGGGDVSFGVGRFAGASYYPFVSDGDRLLVRQTFWTSDERDNIYEFKRSGWLIFQHTVDVYFIKPGDSPDWYNKVHYNRYDPSRTFNNASLGTSSYMFGFSLGGLNSYNLSWTIKPRRGITLNEFAFVPISNPRTLKVNGVDISPDFMLSGSITKYGDNGMKEDCCECIEAMASLLEAYLEKVEKLINESEARQIEHANDMALKICKFFTEQLKAFDIIDDDRILKRLDELENNLWNGGTLESLEIQRNNQE